jgi:hypothetical protein
MSATAERLRARSRWSAASRCSRWAALGLLGAEPTEPDEQTKGRWARGRLFQRLVLDKLEARYGSEDVEAEPEFPWPAGEGHGDALIRSERLMIEVKSCLSLEPNDAMWTQLAGEVIFHSDADAGALYLIDPDTMAERVLPFLPTQEWEERVRGIVDEVVRAGKTEVLPPCSACTPTECRFKGCPYSEIAWEGWEPPGAIELEGEHAKLVAELFQVERSHRGAKDIAAQYEAERDEIRRQLAAILKPGVEHRAGSLRVRMTEVKPRTTYDVLSMLAGGIVSEEEIEPHRKVGAPSRRWTVKQVGDGELLVANDPDDFGDVPF